MDEITQLKQQVQELQKKVDDLYSTAGFPEEILRTLKQKGFMRVSKALESFGQSGAEFDNFFVDYLQKTTVIAGIPSSRYIQFTVDSVSSNTLKIPIGSDMNNAQVVALSSDELPAPLTAANIYYIKNATGTTVELAGTPGGTTIDITDIGSGTHFLRFI